jgi:hypothetical protein
MTHTRSALVIGGGIAGPVAAMALQKAGIQATVYEAYSGLAEGVGGGLTIAPNGLSALEVIGAAEAVQRIGVPTTALIIESWTGKRLNANGLSLTLLLIICDGGNGSWCPERLRDRGTANPDTGICLTMRPFLLRAGVRRCVMVRNGIGQVLVLARCAIAAAATRRPGTRRTSGAAWLRLIRLAVVPTALTVVWLGQPAGATVAPARPWPGGGAARAAALARARAESKAFAARSRLSTAQLIRAAKDAGSRLPVHTTPPAPKGIRVHPSIVHTRSVMRVPGARSRLEAAAAFPGHTL